MPRVAAPPKVNGTGRVSPLTRPRFRVTVNSFVPPSATVPPVPAKVTVVASLSVMVISAAVVAPATWPAGSVPSSTTTFSSGSSALSLVAVKVVVPALALLEMLMLAAPSV